MKYGLFDTVDNCWLGNDDGPKTFAGGQRVNDVLLTDEDAELLARVSAEMVTGQLGWPHSRISVRPIPDGIDKLRDELSVQMTPDEWLRRKMRGSIP